MTKLNRGGIRKERELSYSVDAKFDGYSFQYPLAGVNSCHYEAKVYKRGEYDHAEFSIDVVVSLFDAYDNEKFDEEYHIEEEDDLLLEEDGEGVGYIIPSTTIDLDEVVASIIQSAMPIKPLREGSQLPKEVGGVKILSEEEYIEESMENNINNNIQIIKNK